MVFRSISQADASRAGEATDLVGSCEMLGSMVRSLNARTTTVAINASVTKTMSKLFMSTESTVVRAHEERTDPSRTTNDEQMFRSSDVRDLRLDLRDRVAI